jgi:hypothetical protein
MRTAIAAGWILLAAAGLGGCGSDDVVDTDDNGGPEAGEADYVVTFTAVWSEETHPDDFPGNPHFSRLVGATHGAEVTLWEVGGVASQGIEAMAETGATGPLESEAEDAIAMGTARRVLVGGGISTSPGEVAYEFRVDEDFPLVTLVSMIAPSPDWFVGVSGLSLHDGGGWVDSLTVDLFPYDAGTDSGAGYTAADADTDPQVPISRIEGYPFLVDDEVPPLGTFTFVRQLSAARR